MKELLNLVVWILLVVCCSNATEEGKILEFGEEFKGLKAEILIPPPENCERYSKRGDMVSLHYKGWMAKDMSMFETSFVGNNLPEKIHLGTRERIAAWDLALVDMCVGEKRKLIVPAEYGFGEWGSRDGKVGGFENLIYEIEMMEIEDGPVQGPIEAFTNIDKDNDGYLTMEEVSEFIRIQEETHDIEAAEDNEHNAMVADIFKLQDVDRDGALSMREFSGHDEL